MSHDKDKVETSLSDTKQRTLKGAHGSQQHSASPSHSHSHSQIGSQQNSRDGDHERDREEQKEKDIAVQNVGGSRERSVSSHASRSSHEEHDEKDKSKDNLKDRKRKASMGARSDRTDQTDRTEHEDSATESSHVASTTRSSIFNFWRRKASDSATVSKPMKPVQEENESQVTGTGTEDSTGTGERSHKRTGRGHGQPGHPDEDDEDLSQSMHPEGLISSFHIISQLSTIYIYILYMEIYAHAYTCSVDFASRSVFVWSPLSISIIAQCKYTDV